MTSNNNEPSMFLQRPSSAKSQDTSHILSRIFRDVYSRDPLTIDTVECLIQSADGEDEYHKEYVDELRQVIEDRNKTIAEITLLEKHIQGAQASAIVADEQELNNRNNMPDLGLPPSRSHLRRFLNSDLLKKNKLITPQDYSPFHLPVINPPSANGLPNYTRETTNFSRRSTRQTSSKKVIPQDDFLQDFEHLPSEDESETYETSPSTNKNKGSSKQINQNNSNWKAQISAEDREQAKNILSNLHSRVEFLKNPRFVQNSSSSLLSKSTKSNVFLAVPNVITFTDYVQGEVYEAILELKNISKVLRPIRVIPPKTSFFSISLGRFPAEDGLIAAGISCKYTIRFAPDCHGDFDDELIIQTTDDEFIVPLQGKREAPQLNIPSIIDLGGSLIGGTKVGQIQFTNSGGPGRFIIIPRSYWPTTQFKNKLPNSTVSLPPFEVRPSFFAIRPGQQKVLEVFFSPTELKSYESEITFICDNCQAKHFKLIGMGQLPNVRLTDLEGGEIIPGVDELVDIDAEHYVNFGQLNPFTFNERNLTVKNETDVDLPFTWVIIKPEFCEEKAKGIRVRDNNSRFTIVPESGLLLANESMMFQTAFAPPTPGNYHSVLHLVLPQLPAPNQSSINGAKSIQVSPSGSASSITSGSKANAVEFEDVIAMQVDIRGKCEPFSVLLQPYALKIPGTIPIQTVVKRPVHVINQSISHVQFYFKPIADPVIIHVEPSQGEIPPNMDCEVEICITGSCPGTIEENLECYIQYMDEPLLYNVQAEFSGPQVIVDESAIDFGLVRQGFIEERWLTIRNQSRVAANWSIKMTEDKQLKNENEIEMHPKSGQLLPLKAVQVKITLKADTVTTLKSLLELQVENGNHLVISCNADIQTPKVCLTESRIKLDDVFVEGESSYAIVLYNQTVLPTTFCWGEIVGKGKSNVTAVMKPNEGRIEKRETMACMLTVVAHSLENIEDLRIPCCIEGQPEPVWLSFSCRIKGLSVSFKSEDCDYDLPNVNVNIQQLKIGDVITKKLILRNNTSIISQFNCNLTHFGIRPPTPPQDSLFSNKGQRQALMQRSVLYQDKPNRTARAKMESQRTILKNTRGLALTVEPSNGVLGSYAEVEINITACSNLWGLYEDEINFHIGDLEPEKVPITVNVTGSPLLLQLSASMVESQAPILRFGSHIAGSNVVRRQLKILNNGACDIRLDWKTFDKYEDDEQLIDLIVAYRPAFPLKNKNNDVISPRDEIQRKSFMSVNELSFPTLNRDETQHTSKDTSLVSIVNPINDCLPPEPRPKLIDLHIFPHIGQKSTFFEVEPSQIIVPADGSNTAVVNLYSPLSKTVNNPLDIAACGRGYLTICDENVKENEQVSRKDGYFSEPISFEMTASILPTTIFIEFDDDDELNFKVAASDLIKDGNLLDDYLHLKSIKLQNPTTTPIRFQMQTKSPFYIADELGSDIRTQTDYVIIQARHHLKVKIGFRLSYQLFGFLNPSLINLNSNQSNIDTSDIRLLVGGQSADARTDIEIEQCVDAPPESSTGNTLGQVASLKTDILSDQTEELYVTQLDEGVSYSKQANDVKLNFNSEFLIKYDNGEVKSIPVSSSVSLPSLRVSRNKLHIGNCLVGESRQKMFSIGNPSLCESFWTISIEKLSENCSQEVFHIEPDSGLLKPGQSVLVCVSATPNHSEFYEMDLIVHGLLTETAVKMHVTASGSYDTRHEVLLPT